jgi:hypothetical protein
MALTAEDIEIPRTAAELQAFIDPSYLHRADFTSHDPDRVQVTANVKP